MYMAGRCGIVTARQMATDRVHAAALSDLRHRAARGDIVEFFSVLNTRNSVEDNNRRVALP